MSDVVSCSPKHPKRRLSVQSMERHTSDIRSLTLLLVDVLAVLLGSKRRRLVRASAEAEASAPEWALLVEVPEPECSLHTCRLE